MNAHITKVDRRSFLKAGAMGATGLVIGFYMPGSYEALAAQAAAAPIALNAWIHIGTDDLVTIYIDKSEMGQSILTGLAMIAADELECDWKKVRTEFAPAAKVYINRQFGVQATGASSSTRSSWEPLREAGATAREMLLAAAAQRWKVPQSQCRAENGMVVHAGSKRRLSYGRLAAAAAKLPAPHQAPLKAPGEFLLIGKPTKRLDTPIKVNGEAEFGIDVRRPGMLYAAVARCPVFGGKVSSFDATKAKAMRGVKTVLQISSGVAVVADNTWTAIEASRALAIQWDEGPNANVSSASISKLFAERAAQPGAVARKDGDPEAVLAAAAKKIEAVYEVPYLAHATMEPMNCTADVRAGRCDVWGPTQNQTGAQNTAAQITGLPIEKVFIHTTFLGGGFGRRFESDYVADAVEVSKAAGAPVKVTWSREDDIQHDHYRPASYARFAAGFDAQGQPVAWINRIASPSIMARFGPLKNNLDRRSTEICDSIPYAIPNILVDYHLSNAGIPVGFWRSVGASQNGFFLESFIDEVAAAAGEDPYLFRRRLLTKSPRHMRVLDLAARKAGWDKPLPAGRFRGIAVVSSYFGYVAQVIEISLNRQAKSLRVHRVVCALDCGRIVNPASITVQVQGSVVFGLTAALKDAITIDHGRVQQHNYNDYQMLRIPEMPIVEVYTVPSELAPTGAGEFTVPPVAPALCNAIYAATGRRIRRLPIRTEDLA